VRIALGQRLARAPATAHEAAALLRDAWQLRRDTLGAAHPATLEAQRALAQLASP